LIVWSSGEFLFVNRAVISHNNGILRSKTMLKRTKQKGFTIVELLTVMSIIIIIMSILVPALSGARKFAARVRQKAQFYEISKGLEDFEKATGAYPDSGQFDVCSPPARYCGAMKLCEAMMGQDGMGFHPDSGLTALAGMDPHDTTGTLRKYPFNLCTQHTGIYTTPETTNLRYRDSGRYLDIENVRAYRIQDVWGAGNIGLFTANNANNDYPNSVISDVFLKPTILASCTDRAGEKVGMPVLYYKADTSMVEHYVNTVDPRYPMFNIYRYTDNDDLVNLGLPWELTTSHPMSSNYESAVAVPPIPVGTTFYQVTRNKKVTSTPRPHNEGKYILISAGWDGLYGTSDDVYNFTD
jgi:prepilin-type N-terminal cleavage/methylation domain-containing protein